MFFKFSCQLEQFYDRGLGFESLATCGIGHEFDSSSLVNITVSKIQ